MGYTFEASQIEQVQLYPFNNPKNIYRGDKLIGKTYSKWGYKDNNGTVIIEPQFNQAQPFYGGRANVTDRNWYEGSIDRTGRIVIPYNFVEVSDFAGDLAYFHGTRDDRDKKGFIDLNGNIVLEFTGVDRVDVFPGFGGFKNGRTTVFAYDHKTVPWGCLLPYGNPVPRIYGYVDCTGRVKLSERKL